MYCMCQVIMNKYCLNQYCKHSNIQTKGFYHGVIAQYKSINDANGIANIEDPDQTAPLGAVL